jgi:thiamine pyrophosphate-dependent acetolactate synthase large subunit-like protein
VKNKQYDSFGGRFDELWKKAKESIAKADEIVIIGYSFPETDYKSDLLFRQAFSERSDMPKITILDPFPENIVDRFRFNFGISGEKITIFKEYFTEDFDLTKIFEKSV